MRIETQLKIKQSGKSKVDEIIRFMRYGKKTTLEVWKEYRDYKQTLKNRKTPNAILEYLNGRFEYQLEQIQNNEVEFVYIIDGKVYSTWKETSFNRLNSEQYPLINDDTKHGHVWKGTLKPISGVLNGIYSNNEYGTYTKAIEFCDDVMKGV